MSLRQVIYAECVSESFVARVLEICGRLAIDPDWLMAIMHFESAGSFSPTMRNRAGSGAIGLIQFLPSTARELGTSIAGLAAMSADDQLHYVEKYFTPYKGRMRTIEDAYMAVLYPKAIGWSGARCIFYRGMKAYEMNCGLDFDHDGKISKAHAAAPVVRALVEGRRAMASTRAGGL